MRKEDGMFYHKYGKSFLCIGVLIALVFTATCSLQPVSSIRIKAEPKVFLPLGSKSIGEDEVFKKFEEALQKNTSGTSDKKMRLYRYQSGQDDKLRYLVHYPLETFDFNLNNYFNGDSSGSGGEISGNNKLLSKEIKADIHIPRIDTSESFPVDASAINDKLLGTFNAGSPLPSIPVPAGLTEQPLGPISIDFQNFTTITFGAESYLKISASPTSGAYTITKAQMTSNGETINGDISGYDVRFPLAGKTIDTHIDLTLTVKDVGTSTSANITRKLEGKIIRATGVNAAPEITPASKMVDIPLPAKFKSAEIGNGNLTLSMDQPAEWRGITIQEQTSITQTGSGGLQITPSSFQSLGITNLGGRTLNDQRRLTCTPKFKVTLANATYTYADNLSVKFNFSITKFSKITMETEENFKEKRKEDPVPPGMKSWVKNIHFTTASVKIKLNNGLPEGNNIKIKLASNCFKITPAQEKTFSHGETEKEYRCNNGSSFDLPVMSLNNFDLTTQILPGHNADDNTYTLHDITTDSDIKLSGLVQFNLDNWDTITLKARNNEEGHFPQNDYMNLSALTSKLKDEELEPEEIPVYFYAGSQSKLLASQKMKVKLTANYHKHGETSETSKDLVNTPTEIPLKGLPAGTFPSDNKKPVTGGIPDAMFVIKEEEPGVGTTLGKIMNEYPKDLKLKYIINMDEITISHTDYDKPENRNAKVSIDLILEVPVGFKVKNNREISLKKLFGMDMSGTDLFRRNGPNDKPLGNDLISDAFRSINVNINFKNGMNRSPNFILRFKDGSDNPVKDDSGKTIEESVAITGEKTIKLTTENWKKLVKTYPVSPEFLLELPAGSYSLKNNFELGASLTVLAETNVDYTYNRK